MSKVLSVRVDDELADWAETYALERGVTKQALLADGLRSFREDCESGVPEIRKQIRAVADPVGVGSCAKSATGHVWGKDERRACVHCKQPGRDGVGESGGFFAETTMARAELFSGLRSPASTGWGAGGKRS